MGFETEQVKNGYRNPGYLSPAPPRLPKRSNTKAMQHTGWRWVIGCLIFMGHFLQKSCKISGSFADREAQLKAPYASSPPCTKNMEHTNEMQHTATHCNALQHTATHCNSLQHTATHCNTLQLTATHCNTLQHTATHCNTLQHQRNAAYQRYINIYMVYWWRDPAM